MNNQEDKFDHNRSWQSDAVANKYDQQRFSSITGRTHDVMEKKAISKLLEIAQKDHPIKRVLDLPSGTGRISELLMQHGFDLCCGDISKEMLNVAKQKLSSFDEEKQEFSVMDIYNIDRDSESFDCVTCIRLFQHLKSEERAKALKELARVSKEFVIVNVMYTSPYYGLVRKARKLLGAYAPRYTVNKNELASELQYASLKIVKAIFSQPFYSGNMLLLLKRI